MWPMLLDLSPDESKRMLRRLELEGYSSVVSAFRAQGELSKDKKKLLQELQKILSIPVERHRAEVRRALNDEKLSTVAHHNGSTETSEWLIEGRRLIPLLPRLVPQTAFTQTANQAAREAAEKNSHLINPALTGNKELASQSSLAVPGSAVATVAAKPSRPTSPTSNVVVLPSGTSIHIKGILNPDEEEETLNRHQRRSLSVEGLAGAATASTQTQTARVIYTTASSTPGTASPVKITISKSPQGRAIVSQPGGQPPKVILVTSSSQSAASSVYQRSMSVPVIRASTSTSTSHAGATRTSIIIPGSPGMAHASPAASSMPGVITVTTNSITTSSSGTVTMPTSVVGGSPVFSPSINIGKPRAKVITRHRFPQPSKPGVVIPMGPGGSQPVAPSPQNLHNIHVKTIAKPPPIHIKQEGGMKIITQTGASKILPKPAQLSGSPGTPVVVVNAGPSASGGGSTTVTMMPKTVSTFTTSSGSKVLNISAPGGRVIANTKAPNVVTVNPKTLQLTAVKSAAGGTTVSKSNVIVVQKTQPRRQPLPARIPKGNPNPFADAFEKELANFIQKDCGRQVSVSISPSGAVSSTTATLGGRTAEQHRVIISTSGTTADIGRQNTMHKLMSTDAENRKTLLEELIHANDLQADSGTEIAGIGGNEWFEFDDSGQSVSHDSLPGSSVQAIMGLSNSATKIVRRTSGADDHAGLTQETYYSLEQAMSLLNSDPTEGAAVISGPSVQRIITHSGEQRILTTAPGSGPSLRRLSTSVLTDQGLVHTVRADPNNRALSSSANRGERTSLSHFHPEGLDPETGIFYGAPGVSGAQIMVRDGSILTSQPPVLRRTATVVSEPREVSSHPVQQNRPVVQSVISVSTPPMPQPPPQPPQQQQQPQQQQPASQPMDLLSSSLAQAQINLESFDFEDDGLEPYVPLQTDSVAPVGGVVVAAAATGTGGEVGEQSQFEVEEEEEEEGGYEDDAHTAATLLNAESEARDAAQLMNTVQQVAPHVGFSNTTVAVPNIIVASQLQQQQQQQPQPSGQSSLAPAIAQVTGRPTSFVPLEEVKGARSSGINIVTHGQRDLPSAAAYVSSTPVSSSAAAIVNNTSSSTTTTTPSVTVLPPTTTTTTVLPSTTTSVSHSSKVLTTASVSTPPTVSVSLPPSLIVQPSPSTRLSPLPVSQGSSSSSSSSGSCSTTCVSQNSVQSSVVLSQNSAAAVSSGSAAIVSVTSSVRNSTTVAAAAAAAAAKPLAVTASPLSHTVVLDSSESVERTVGSAPSSLSSAVVVTSNAGAGRNVTVLGDGHHHHHHHHHHLSAMNSRLDGHTADNNSVTVVPLGDGLSGAVSLPGATVVTPVVEFAALATSEVVEPDMEFVAVGDADSSDKTADGLNFDANALRQSKRKRKLPSALEEAAGGSAGGSWVRAASNILVKVSRFRGANREKGELNAAAWFTHPVEEADAPDYYTIIEKPMDFSTIRKKLESGVYSQFEDFHTDMQLIRDNCFLYNSANTRVYQDCTQVFRFYQQEIDRLLEKSPTKSPAGQTGSPPKKTVRIDKSPGKT